MLPSEVVVVGQVARGLVVEIPEPGAPVRRRPELLGGQGAHQAVALGQLGTSVSLVGVVGSDRVGDTLRAQALADRIGTSHLVRRPDTETATVIDVVDDHGRRQHLEHVPDATLVTEADVAAAAALISAAGSVVVQLNQPAATALLAARLAHRAGTRVVLDGAPREPALTADLLALSDVVHAAAPEAEELAGWPVTDVDTATRAAAGLRRRGPAVAVLEVPGRGTLFAGPEDNWFLPHVEAEVVDPTGAGDALVATLTAALTRRQPLETAARLAVAAAAATAAHKGGRPRLTRLDRLRPDRVEAVLA
jgi:ribokinase